MTYSEQIRQYFIDNPQTTEIEAVHLFRESGVSKANVYNTLRRAVERGLAVKNDDGTYDFTPYANRKNEMEEIKEWKNDIRKELVERLIEANNIETDSNQIRLNSKEIRQLLNEIF